MGGRVDEKGRLKLPVAFQALLSSKPLFITTLDQRIGRIYALSVWEANEKLLAEERENPRAAEDIAFIANVYGGDAEVDGQGRVLIPSELRKRLNLENQPVWIQWFRDGVNIYSKEIYDARFQRAENGLDGKVEDFHRKGLN